MLCLSLAYAAPMILLRTLTGKDRWDGIIGVVLGLFISSLPARHFVEMLLYWRVEGPRFRSRRARALWVACNALVLLDGWIVIVMGTTRFIPAA